jgi:DNA repair protein RecO (recombination protein O)
MSIERATGLVLRTFPLTESSLIVRWLTPQCGRLATVAKGARRPKSPFRGRLDLFYEAAFTFHRSRRSSLHTLREVELLQTHPSLRQHLPRLYQAAYAALWLERVTEEEAPVPALYALLHALLESLATQPAQPQLIFAFELKLLAESGLAPDWGTTPLSPGTRQFAQALLSFELAHAARLQPTPLQAEELSRFLQAFLTYHLGRTPRGRDRALAAAEGVSPHFVP